MDNQIYDILNIIDLYLEVLENPEALEKVDINIMKRTFEACVFIENVVKKVQEEKKEAEFESHLHSVMYKKNKVIVYQCSDLKNACDKILERFLINEKIPLEIIDELLKLYILKCGNIRLEKSIKNILIHSVQSNSILQFFHKAEVNIENHVLIASWEQEIKNGHKKKVIEYLIDMFEKNCISKLIQLAHEANTNNPVNRLILNFFSKKLEENHITLYNELRNTKKKVLLKLLVDSPKFQVSFFDTTFYMGRNLEPNDEDQWVTSTGFSYDDLKNIINILLAGSEEIHKMVVDRIKLAKELDAVWEAIEKDCIL